MATASFGRKWLAGIIRNEDLSPEEKEQQIMEGHIGVTDGLKDKIETLQAEADKAKDLQKQLDSKDGGEDWEAKWKEEHDAFENFKKQTAQDAEATKVRNAYRKLLIEEKIGEKRAEAILKVTDFSKLKLTKDGKLEGEDDIRKSISEEWGEFQTTVTERGANVENPPHTSKSTMSKADILAIKDTSERQKAIAENLNLFGKG